MNNLNKVIIIGKLKSLINDTIIIELISQKIFLLK